MANKKIEMSIIRQVSQLKSNGQSIRSIAELLGISRNTVRKYLRLFQGQGLSMAAVLELEDPALDELIEPSQGADPDRYLTLLELFPACERELKRTGVTRGVLWGEYKALHPGGYNYSRFCYVRRVSRSIDRLCGNAQCLRPSGIASARHRNRVDPDRIRRAAQLRHLSTHSVSPGR